MFALPLPAGRAADRGEALQQSAERMSRVAWTAGESARRGFRGLRLHAQQPGPRRSVGSQRTWPACPAKSCAWKSAETARSFPATSRKTTDPGAAPKSTASRKTRWSNPCQPQRPASRSGVVPAMTTSGTPARTSASASRTPKPSSPPSTLPRPMKADAATKARLKLFAQARHQMSSPSFLICS